MTLDEAIQLARDVVACDPQVMIIAIGRFLPSDQIQADSPWMVSIHEPGHERPRVLIGSGDFAQFKPNEPMLF